MATLVVSCQRVPATKPAALVGYWVSRHCTDKDRKDHVYLLLRADGSAVRTAVPCRTREVATEEGRWGATDRDLVFRFASRPTDRLRYERDGEHLKLVGADGKQLELHYRYLPVETADHPPALLGAWQNEDRTSTYCFKADGTAVVGSFDFFLLGVPWRANSEYVTISHRAAAHDTFKYRLSGKRLVVQGPGEQEMDLSRVGDSCEGLHGSGG